MAFNLPHLPSTEPTWPQWQIWWQQVVDAIEAQEARQDEILVDLATALASLSEIAPITFDADYQGNIDPADQLPYLDGILRYEGDTDVTAEAEWTISEIIGGISVTIGLNTGIFEITDVDTSGSFTVSSDRDGIVKTRLVQVVKNVAAAPSTGDGTGGGGGGGGTTYPSASDTTFNSINSAAHAAISDVLTVTVGDSTEVDLSAVLTVRTAADPPEGDFAVWGKWQWWDGAAWDDVAAETLNALDTTVTENVKTGALKVIAGNLTVNETKTGLTTGVSEQFRLVARNDSGVRVMTFTGTASAVPT